MLAHKLVMKEPPPTAVVQQLQEYAVVMTARAMPAAAITGRRSIPLQKDVKQALDKAGVLIAVSRQAAINRSEPAMPGNTVPRRRRKPHQPDAPGARRRYTGPPRLRPCHDCHSPSDRRQARIERCDHAGIQSRHRRAERVVPSGGAAEVDAAVQAAQAAFPGWAATIAGQARQVMFEMRRLLMERAKDQLARAISAEHGKTHADALGEVARGLEVVEFACGIPHLLKGSFSPQVSGRHGQP